MSSAASQAPETDDPHAFDTINAVCDATGFSMAEKGVLMVLARHATGRTGKSAYPAQETIAIKACMGRRTVNTALKSLEEDGIILRGDQSILKKRAEGGKQQVVWDINLPALRARCLTDTQTAEQCATAAHCNVQMTTEQCAAGAHKQPLEQPLVNNPRSKSAHSLREGVSAAASRGKSETEKRWDEWREEDRDKAASWLEESGVLYDNLTADVVYDGLLANGIDWPGLYLESSEYRAYETGSATQYVVERRAGI